MGSLTGLQCVSVSHLSLYVGLITHSGKLGSRPLVFLLHSELYLSLSRTTFYLLGCSSLIPLFDINDTMTMRATLTSGSMFSSWRALLLPLALISIIISGTAIFGARSHSTHDSLGYGRLRRALDGVVHPDTARAIAEDEVLRRNYEAVVDITAGATEWLAVRYPSEQLREISESLNVYRRDIAANAGRSTDGQPRQRRGLTDLLGGGAAAVGMNSSASLLSSVGDSIMGGISNIGNSLCKQLS